MIRICKLTSGLPEQKRGSGEGEEGRGLLLNPQDKDFVQEIYHITKIHNPIYKTPIKSVKQYSSQQN